MNAKALEISGQLAEVLAQDVAGSPTASGAAGRDDSSKSKGEGLAPIPAVLSPLHELEESLLAYFDSEELVTEEQEAEFVRDLSATMQATVAKRDRVGSFIKHCEGQAALAADEIRRLSVRKRILENTAERLRGYVLWIIEASGPNDNGKLRKLEGDKFTFSTRKAKPKLEITDPLTIPNQFCDVCLTLPAELYYRYQTVLKALLPDAVVSPLVVNEDMLRKHLEGAPTECEACAGIQRFCPSCGGSGVIPPSVPGARLLTDRNTLILK